MPPMPVEADAPPDLVTPLHRKARGLGLKGAALEFGGRGNFAVEQIEIGELARQQRRIGETDIFVVGRDAGHRDRPLGEFCDAVAGNIVGRDHRLALPDQYAQSDIVAFGALGFLDPAITHFDALRDAAYRDRVGGVRARALGGLDQSLRQRRERRLIEQVGSLAGASESGEALDGEEFTNKIPDIEEGGNANRQGLSDVPDSRGVQAFCDDQMPNIFGICARSRQSCVPRSCQSCGEIQGG